MEQETIVGIDEAGRGPWAGPLIAAAVMLDGKTRLSGVKDSKQLTALRRKELMRLIIQNAQSIGIGWAGQETIDRIGLQRATQSAMQIAYDQLPSQKSPIIIDGSINYLPELPGSEAVVKADAKVSAVSAASIVAKYYRDSYMQQMDKLYPEYEFIRHVGYGTKRHRLAIERHGICCLHRLSFAPIKNSLLDLTTTQMCIPQLKVVSDK